MCNFGKSDSNYRLGRYTNICRNKKRFPKKFLKLTGGIPHHVTYERVFSLIDSKELESILNRYNIKLK